jgi:methylaspartate mutase sigma subunit
MFKKFEEKRLITKNEAGSQRTLVTGVIGYDVHLIGIRLVERALRGAGYSVVSLGVQVSPEEFIAAAMETNAGAILISSLDGHARLWVQGFREKCRESGLADILLYLGGMLTIGESKWEDTEKMFKDMGINRVYPQSVRTPQIVADLKSDLAIRA